jgi:hypothetical protein
MVREVETSKPLETCNVGSTALPRGELPASPSAKAEPNKPAKARLHKPLAGHLTVYNYAATAEDRIILRVLVT